MQRLPDCEVPSYCQGEEAGGEESPEDQEDPAESLEFKTQGEDRTGGVGVEMKRRKTVREKAERGLLQARGQLECKNKGFGPNTQK